ncbi:hypothetical protein AC1031_003240 [Aphanomyces cochlioides]|nr:hypothetical protein AC1031_003240 [Aphanomyces cochlioides]
MGTQGSRELAKGQPGVAVGEIGSETVQPSKLKESAMVKAKGRGSAEEKQEAGRRAAEPEAEAKVDEGEEKPKADAAIVKEEPGLAGVTEYKSMFDLGPVATMGGFPMLGDFAVDIRGYPTSKLSEKKFMVRAREMTSAELWYTQDRHDFGDAQHPGKAGVELLSVCGSGHPMDYEDCQHVYNLLGLWDSQMDPSKMCASLRYLMLLYNKSGCRAADPATCEAKAKNVVWPYVPLALLPNESLEEYFLCFSVAFFTPKRGK